MKRAANLYAEIHAPGALHAAWLQASRNKRSHRACFEFSRALGSNLAGLERELISGAYAPRPCNSFWVTDGPKPRLIEAPAFRDMVVQHSAYAVIGPLFERRYINTNFACRPGKGTHRAADWLQSAMQNADRDAWALHVDVRKFFYSIDRDILAGLLARAIKCRATLNLLSLFAKRAAPTGVPISNLLSQTFANIYLNSLDHYCKRDLKLANYARYMDDSIMIVPSRAAGIEALDAIRSHLARLNLEISHYNLQPIRRGINYVGFRTWSRARFVRPRVLTQFRRAARGGDLPGVASRLGHARHTSSHRHMLDHLQEHHHALYCCLPQSLRRLHNPPTGNAR